MYRPFLYFAFVAVLVSKQICSAEIMQDGGKITMNGVEYSCDKGGVTMTNLTECSCTDGSKCIAKQARFLYSRT